MGSGTRRRDLVLAALAAFLIAGGAAPKPVAAEGPRAAVFDIELNDTSHEGELRGPREDEAERTRTASAYMRELLAESGVELVDMAPAAGRLADVGPIRRCNGCERRIARDLGADVTITGTVQKVSNLILNVNIFLRDAETGAVLAGGSADIRGNNDESWNRGVRSLIQRQIVPATQTAEAEPPAGEEPPAGAGAAQ